MNTLILALFKSGDKLKLSSVCHLLNGKRTASVLTFGFFQDSLSFFGLFPTMTIEFLEKSCLQLSSKGLLTRESDRFVITEKGLTFFYDEEACLDSKFDGVTHSRTAQAFFELLLFATQVVSNASYKESNYIPIDSNNFHHYQVKRWYAKNKVSPSFVVDFYEEWERLVLTLPEEKRSGLVAMLSGFTQVGQTFDQVFYQKEQYRNKLENYLAEISLQHSLIKEVAQIDKEYPLFKSLYDILLETAGNHSASETYRLSKEGNAIDAIKSKRKLKESTVVDHIIEGLILDDEPDYSLYLPADSKRYFEQYLQKNSDFQKWRFREVVANKEHSFLSFRTYQIMKEKERRSHAN